MATRDSTVTNPVATFDYLRKSTKGEVTDDDGRKHERQEDSIERQREGIDSVRVPRQIADAGFTDFEVVAEFIDPGVSGWKIANRPALQKLLAALAKHSSKCKVIRVDHLNRLSRASLSETQTLFGELKDHGVRWIVTTAGTIFDLGADNDIVSYMTVGMYVWLSHEESKTKSKFVSDGMKIKARDGKRMGGRPPYGLRRDAEMGLVPGDECEVENVCRVFSWFVEGKSLRWIAESLNAENVPAPQGKYWHRATVAMILRQPAYAGMLAWGRVRAGRFYQIDESGKSVEITTADFVEVKTREGRKEKRPPRIRNAKAAILKDDAHAAIIDRKQFDSAQRRLASIGKKRKPRSNGYAFSGGILRCDHCGGALVPENKNGTTVRYKCVSSMENHKQCRNYAVREDEILLPVLNLLSDEINALLAQMLMPKPPAAPPKPDLARQIQRAEARIDELAKDAISCRSSTLRRRLDAAIEELEKQLAELKSAQATPADEKVDVDALRQLANWSKHTLRTVVSVSLDTASPIAKKLFPTVCAEASKPQPWDEWMTPLLGGSKPGATFLADFDRRGLNEALHGLGCEVRLRWKSEPCNIRCRHTVQYGRFRLGRRTGEIALNVDYGKPRNPGLCDGTPSE